jgi:pilus assembly protein CpaB
MILLFSRPQKSLSADRTAKAQTTPRIVLIEKEPTVETVVLLVPKKDILPGQKLSSDDFMLTVRPKDLVPQGSLSKFEQIINLESTALLVKDTPITQQMVMNPKLSNPIISSIEPGYRAVTILVNATSAVEGWATAGAYVDVHWVTNSFGDYTVNLLAQNAKILSAERQAETAQTGSTNQQQAAVIPTTVTLLLTDRDAQKISLASTGGELKLHLRGTEDANKASQATVLTMNDLLGGTDDSKMPRGVIKIRDEKGHLQEFSLKNGQIVSRKIA